MIRVISEYLHNFAFARGLGNYFQEKNEKEEKNKDLLSDKILRDKLMYAMHIHLYGCFFSDHPWDWIYPSFSFERNCCLFLFALLYENGYLWIKVEKVGGENPEDVFLTQKDIEWLKKLNEKDFILVYTGKMRKDNSGGGKKDEQEEKDDSSAVQMEFKKWIGDLNVGYSELLDRIHLIFYELIAFFGAKMAEWDDGNGNKRNLLEIGMEEKKKILEEKEEIKDTICETYYYQGMNDFGWNKNYSYEGWKEISDAVDAKLKILTSQIYEMNQNNK